MQRIFVHLLDFILKPFYSALIFFPFTIKIGKHPLYKQLQYLHFNLTKKRRNADIVSKITPLKNCSFKMILAPGVDFHQFHLLVTGFYEKELSQKIARDFIKSDVFIDVGAYLGYFSIMAATISPEMQVYAYEPQKEAFDILNRNMHLNNTVINANNFALGSQNEGKTLFIDRFPERSSLIEHYASTCGIFQTSVKKLDDLQDIRQKNIVVKIDTEGYEFEVLKGMKNLLQQNNCIVYFEYNLILYQILYGEECLIRIEEFFEALNYDVYAINANSEIRLYTFKKEHNYPQNLLVKRRRANSDF